MWVLWLDLVNVGRHGRWCRHWGGPFWLTLLLACGTSNPPCHGVAGLMEPPRCLVQFFFIWEDAQPTGQQLLFSRGTRGIVCLFHQTVGVWKAMTKRLWCWKQVWSTSAWRSLVWTPRPSRCLRKSNLSVLGCTLLGKAHLSNVVFQNHGLQPKWVR